VVLPIRSGSEEETVREFFLPEAGEFFRRERDQRRQFAKLAEYQRVRCWAVWPEADFPRTFDRENRGLPAIAGAVCRKLLGEKNEGKGRGGSLSRIAVCSASGRFTGEFCRRWIEWN